MVKTRQKKRWVTFENWKLHHVNLQAADVRKSVKFIVTNLGLKEGSWRAPDGKGDFSADPKDLSVFSLGAFNGGLHIIKPDPGFALRNNFAINILQQKTCQRNCQFPLCKKIMQSSGY